MRLNLVTVASCALLVTAEYHQHGQRAGLVARDGALHLAARATGGVVDRRHLKVRRPGEAEDYHAANDAKRPTGTDSGEEAEATSVEEAAGEEGTIAKSEPTSEGRPTDDEDVTPTTTAKAKGKPSPTETTEEELATSTTEETFAQGRGTGEPPADGAGEGKGAKAPAFGLAVEESTEGEYAYDDEEPCEDDPYTVYVTVTVTPGTEGILLASPTDGAGGCIDGCGGEGDPAPTAGGESDPVPTAAKEYDEDCEDCYAGGEEGAVITAAPAAPIDEEDEDYASSFSDDDYSDSMSASASASGDADYDGEFGSNAYARFNAMPVILSVGLCALTSLAAGFLVMGL